MYDYLLPAGIFTTITLVMAGMIALHLWLQRPPVQITETKPDRRQHACWMAKWFGTWRPEDYNPAPREEGARMLKFLKGFEGIEVGMLQRITQHAIDKDELPPAPQERSEYFTVIATAIGVVCEQLREAEVT